MITIRRRDKATLAVTGGSGDRYRWVFEVVTLEGIEVDGLSEAIFSSL